MFGVESLSIDASPNAPPTSFPQTISPSNPSSPQHDFEQLLDTLHPILILSDPHECNDNISLFLKSAADFLSQEDEIYHKCSVLSLTFLNSNLFLKNYRLCLGKILSILKLLANTASPANRTEALTLSQVLSIVLLVFFKLIDDKKLRLYNTVPKSQLLELLKDLSFVEVSATFISSQVRYAPDTAPLFEPKDYSHSNYVLLKFNCDIFFNYLYHTVLLSGEEFTQLTECTLIPNLIDHLISNSNFNNYNLSNDDFNDTNKLIAYEEFKLLLLINEQYMMQTYTANDSLANNKVIEGLKSVNGIPGFINLLAYHMNREESHIIKILMLKFLFSILSSAEFCKLSYLNDLKILVDIFIRELNDLDYSENEHSDSPLNDRFLALTYLKTFRHLLVLSQLNDISPKYKPKDIFDLLSNVILNCDDTRQDFAAAAPCDATAVDLNSIVKAAIKCLNILWLKKLSKTRSRVSPLSTLKTKNDSSDSLVSATSGSSRVASLKNSGLDFSASTESFSFTRVASVKANSRSDYNQHTRSHNEELTGSGWNGASGPLASSSRCNMFQDNNSNVSSYLSSRQTLGLLDLPKEYLATKSLPPIPQHTSAGPSRLQEKARQKKAPAPPPPPPRRRK